MSAEMESKQQETMTAFCPNCAKVLREPRVVFGMAALPALYSYYCEDCSEAITLLAKLDGQPLTAVAS